MNLAYVTILILLFDFSPLWAFESDFPGGLEFNQSDQDIIHGLSPTNLPPSPPDKSNRFADDPRAAELGQKLFFDPRFSGRLMDGDNDGSPSTLGRRGEAGKVSCAGCHVPRSGFLDSRSPGRAISLAAGWGRRHAPSLYDVAQNKLLMWDGRRDTFYNQIFEVIESPVEMNSSRLYVAQQLCRFYKTEYEKVFGSMPAFNDPQIYPQITSEKTGCQPKTADIESICSGTMHGLPGDHDEFDHLSKQKQRAVTLAVVNMGKAIASYERKISCGPGRFDSWVHGQRGAMSESEQRGLKVFIGKGNCIQCHSGPYFSDYKFHNLGLIAKTVANAFQDKMDNGAYEGIKKAIEDPLNSKGSFSDGYDGRLQGAPDKKLIGAYKTPMLRCVAQRKAYMHTGQMSDLKTVLEYINGGGPSRAFIGQNELKPLKLSTSEIADLLNFLKALNGPGPASELLGPGI